MGDKSPKSKARQQKQDVVQKEQKKAAAIAKAQPTPVTVLKGQK